MADLAPGLHAVCALLRYSGPDISPASVSGVLRSAFRDSPNRLARYGYLSLRCEATPAPFIQTFRRQHDLLADEWAMVVQALVEVHEHAVPQDTVRAIFMNTARSFGATIDAQGVRLIVEPVADVSRAASAGPFAPQSYPAPYEPWQHTPAPGQTGHVPLPGCGASSFRVPRQGAAPPPTTRPPASASPGTQPTPPPPSTPEGPTLPPSYPAPDSPVTRPPTQPPGSPAAVFTWRNAFKAAAAATAVAIIAVVVLED